MGPRFGAYSQTIFGLQRRTLFGARWTHPDDSAGDCGSPGSRQGPQATRKQAMDLQAANLAALRRRGGQTVVSEGAPARWRLKEGRQPHTSLAFGGPASAAQQ